jgi:transcriptional regulator with XRE-family HTH domain
MEAPELLRQWRVDVRKISQEDAAELAGVHQNTWSDWENGRKTPRTDAALRLDVITEGHCPVWAWADKALRKQWRNGHTANDCGGR